MPARCRLTVAGSRGSRPVLPIAVFRRPSSPALPDSKLARVNSPEAFAQHLEAPLGRGHVPADALTGAAGGAACGDLIRVSLALDPRQPRRADRRRGLRRERLRREHRGRQRGRGPRARRAAAARRRRSARRRSRGELGGLSAAKRHAAELAADALHRALGGAVRASAALAPRGGPHAGGDERRRRQRGGGAARHARRRAGGRGHAGAVVGPGERRRGQLLLGAGGARRARGGARPGNGPPVDRPARGVPRRGRRTRG